MSVCVCVGGGGVCVYVCVLNLFYRCELIEHVALLVDFLFSSFKF